MFDKLPPYAQRANWAHQNSLEAFMIFAAAALMAYVTGINSPVAVGAAIAFVVVRTLYSFFYMQMYTNSAIADVWHQVYALAP